MKKSTRKLIFLIFILITFTLSSIAFVVVNLAGGTQQQQQQLEPLKSFIIEGEIDPRLETVYLNNGFSFLKYYYKEKDESLDSYITSLPDQTVTNFNQKQLFVQKISANSNRIVVRGPGGETFLTGANITESNIFQTLCTTLLFAPPECALNITS